MAAHLNDRDSLVRMAFTAATGYSDPDVRLVRCSYQYHTYVRSLSTGFAVCFRASDYMWEDDFSYKHLYRLIREEWELEQALRKG